MEAVQMHGKSCLDFITRDLHEAIRCARDLDDAGCMVDHGRLSEYHDELCVVAEVRKLLERKPVCPTCGRFAC